MNRIVLDADMRAKLDGGRGRAEFTDEDGNVLGHFLSTEAFERIAAMLLPPPTKEELAAARKEMLEEGGVSTAELLARLDRTRREWEARR